MDTNIVTLDVPFEVLLRAAQRLNTEQKHALAWSLHLPIIEPGPTRDELLAELELLQRTGAFNQAESLRNRYANPGKDESLNGDLVNELYSIVNEWEAELDEFFGDTNPTSVRG